MPQYPDGGERAHPNVEPRFAGDDADATDKSAHELFSILEAPRFQQARQIVERRQTTAKDGIGVDRIVRRGFERLYAVLEVPSFAPKVTELGVHEPLRQTGPHFHIQVTDPNGKRIDPANYFSSCTP